VDLINPNNEETTSQDRQYKAKEAKLQLQSDQLATERKLMSLKAELRSAKAAYPFKSDVVIQLKNQVEATEKGLAALKELEAELF